MRQNSRVEPPTPSSQDNLLHPVLRDALANLDIQLEDELARYRRQRSVPARPGRQPNRKPASQSLDLIAVAATGGRGETTPTPSSTLPVPAPYSNAPAAADYSDYQPVPQFAADHHSPDLAIAVRQPDSSLAHEGGPSAQLAADNAGDSLAAAHQRDLDDYLESSEELLRSLADEEADVQAERNLMQSLLTPLGVGSMLLLLLASAMFGYVVMNPSSLLQLTARNAGNTPNPASQPPIAPNSGQTALAPVQPNLASQEFKDLNLNTLGTLNVSPNGSPSSTLTPPTAPVHKPQATGTATSPANAPSTGATSTRASQGAPAIASANRPEPMRVVEPPVRANLPSRPYERPSRPLPPSNASVRPTTPTAPAPAAPVAAAATGSGDGYRFKVVTHYAGDRSLQDVRRNVPDAFLQNFPDGAKVQAGAYSSQAEAEARAEALRRQGIPAEVYKP